MAYSLDLRMRAIEYFESGKTKLKTSQVFNIDEQTLRKWVLLKKERGSLEPRQHGGGAPSRVSKEALKKYVEEHPDAILETMGKEFGMTIAGIAYHLHKHGYVQKKSLKFMERDESKRSAYLEDLENIPKDKRIYIDESGIAHNMINEYCWAKKRH